MLDKKTYEDMPEAAHEAVHAARDHAQAVEVARDAQMAQFSLDNARQTKESLLEALQEVFGDGDSKDPGKMKVLVQRVPFLCKSVDEMHYTLSELFKKVESLQDNQRWATRIIVGLFVAAVAKVVFIK